MNDINSIEKKKTNEMIGDEMWTTENMTNYL